MEVKNQKLNTESWESRNQGSVTSGWRFVEKIVKVAFISSLLMVIVLGTALIGRNALTAPDSNFTKYGKDSLAFLRQANIQAGAYLSQAINHSAYSTAQTINQAENYLSASAADFHLPIRFDLESRQIRRALAENPVFDP